MATRSAIIQSQHLFSKQNMQIFSPNQHKLIAYMPCKKKCLRGTAFFHSWVEHFLHYFFIVTFFLQSSGTLSNLMKQPVLGWLQYWIKIKIHLHYSQACAGRFELCVVQCYNLHPSLPSALQLLPASHAMTLPQHSPLLPSSSWGFYSHTCAQRGAADGTDCTVRARGQIFVPQAPVQHQCWHMAGAGLVPRWEGSRATREPRHCRQQRWLSARALIMHRLLITEHLSCTSACPGVYLSANQSATTTHQSSQSSATQKSQQCWGEHGLLSSSFLSPSTRELSRPRITPNSYICTTLIHPPLAGHSEEEVITGTRVHLHCSDAHINCLYLPAALDSGHRAFDADCIDTPFASQQNAMPFTTMEDQDTQIESPGYSSQSEGQQQATLFCRALRKKKTLKCTMKVINLGGEKEGRSQTARLPLCGEDACFVISALSSHSSTIMEGKRVISLIVRSHAIQLFTWPSQNLEFHFLS